MSLITEMLVWMMWGSLGGVIRIVISALKSISLKRKIDRNTFLIYCVVMLSISAFFGIVFSFGGKGFSFIGGYAGIDFASGLQKMFMRTKVKVKKKTN